MQALELVKAAYLNVSFMKVQLASICRLQADIFDSHSRHKAREHASECGTLQTDAVTTSHNYYLLCSLVPLQTIYLHVYCNLECDIPRV